MVRVVGTEMFASKTSVVSVGSSVSLRLGVVSVFESFGRGGVVGHEKVALRKWSAPCRARFGA